MRNLDCFVAFAPLFLVPPTFVGRVAHRERRERCDGWGCFIRERSYPHPALRATLRASFARLDPTEDGGRDKKEQPRSISNLQTASQSPAPPRSRRAILEASETRRFFSLPFMGRGAKLVLSFPSHSCGAETSEARSGVARSAGWGQRISMREISRCGNKPHPSHPSLCSGCATLPTSGRDEDRRRGCTVATTARIFTHTHL
jgi:hypothetical protein